MFRGVVGLATTALALCALPPADAFRGDPLPPNDGTPIWSPDATAIAYVHDDRRLFGLHVMTRVGLGDRPLPVPYGSVFSPDWRWVAYIEYEPSGAPALYVSNPEGGSRRRLAVGGRPAWAPTSDRLAYEPPRFKEIQPPAIEVVNVDGTGRQRIAEWALDPHWSPDGRGLAFLQVEAPGTGRAPGPPRVAVVGPEGGNRRVLYAPRELQSFEWSPDGSTIAILSWNRFLRELGPAQTSTLALVRVIDGRVRAFRIPIRVSRLDWSPDGTHIVMDGLLRFDVDRGRAVRLLPFGDQPRYSPDGRWIVFSGGGQCGERRGILVVSAAGGRPARLTNDCRIVGGPGSDILQAGEFSDVLLGLGGDDTLNGLDDFYYEGDELDGGAGDDQVLGSIGTDTLRGGPGRDFLDGGGAPDVLYAVDGERDEVRCGTTRGDVERDVAYVDKRDVVHGDCEYVFRHGAVQSLSSTWLSITVWPKGRAASFHRRTLICAPPRGTLRGRKEACAKLARFGDPFARIPVETACPVRVVDPAVARVVGRFRGRYMTVWLRRTDGCEIARWDRFGFLFVS
jgi:hypothetical protein